MKIFRLRTKDSNSPTMLKQINSSPAAEDLILGKTDEYYVGHLLYRPCYIDMTMWFTNVQHIECFIIKTTSYGSTTCIDFEIDNVHVA